MNINHPDLKALLNVGVHLGHNVKDTHPEMYPHVYGSRNGKAILNLDNTVVALRQTLSVMSNVQKNGGHILFVNKQADVGSINKKVESFER
jgi:small subunit ribosomal protein S2